jgi:hypothetical protein
MSPKSQARRLQPVALHFFLIGVLFQSDPSTPRGFRRLPFP